MQGPMMPPGQSGYQPPQTTPLPHNANAPQIVPSQDEKLLSCLAHASIVIPHAGLIAPLLIWLVHRDGKSVYASYHGKQAFIFHLTVMVIEWALSIIGFLSGFLTFGLGWVLLLPLVGTIHLAATIYGIIGAVQTLSGRDFRYWGVGGWTQPD